MQPNTADLIASFLPLWLLTVPLVIGAIYLAPKMGGSRTLWVILFLIPVVNLFAMYALFFRVAGAMLDRLNEINRKTSEF
jgi:hypothetical protein